MSYGDKQTQQLKQQIEQQLQRLLKQLQDCEDCKADLEPEEYEETKNETLQQMKEFQQTMNKMSDGNMTLVNDLGRIRLAMQAAVSKAFQTPEIIKLFAAAEPKQLRGKLEDLQQKLRLGKINKALCTQQSLEILIALKKLGEDLSAQEKSFLDSNMTDELKSFVAVSEEEVGKQNNILSQTAQQIEKAKK